jgi:hypothetical protein
MCKIFRYVAARQRTWSSSVVPPEAVDGEDVEKHVAKNRAPTLRNGQLAVAIWL